jgi:hypothetical protein
VSRLRDVLSRPTFWIYTHGCFTLAWICLMIPSLLFWRESVPWLVLMSVWANIAGSAASWQSARADLNSPTCEDVVKLQGMVRELLRRVPPRD